MSHLFNLNVDSMITDGINEITSIKPEQKCVNTDITLYKKNLDSILCIGSDKKYISQEQIRHIIEAFSNYDSNYYFSKVFKLIYNQRMSLKEKRLKIKDMLSEYLYTFLVGQRSNSPFSLDLLENLKLKPFDEQFLMKPNEEYYTLDILGFKQGVQSDIIRVSPMILPVQLKDNGGYEYHATGRVYYEKRQIILKLKNQFIDTSPKIAVRTVKRVEWFKDNSNMNYFKKGAIVVYLIGKYEYGSGILELRGGKVYSNPTKVISDLQNIVEITPFVTKKTNKNDEEQDKTKWFASLIKNL
ncbi:hypothetical protein ABC382_01010 [Lysinibacillus sp. 1P01SD]|uniref:hypothetical protein n=1 Tax=Lysinibacillus sp. 1P01SD TaxID=3132285 RepID=UPI00399F6E05